MLRREHLCIYAKDTEGQETWAERKNKKERMLGARNAVPSQAFMLHVSSDRPTHPLPPCRGAGLVQVLVRVPPPHVFEHVPKAEKPPSTGTNTNEAMSHECRECASERDEIKTHSPSAHTVISSQLLNAASGCISDPETLSQLACV